MEYYDGVSWRIGTPMSSQRFEYAGAVGKWNGHDCIFAFGGFDGSTFTNTVERFDPIANTWTFVANMPTIRAQASATAGLDGKIYLIEGADPNNILDTTDVYDPATDQWNTPGTVGPPAMSVQRENLLAATGANGLIYAINGQDLNTTFTSVEAYDPSHPGSPWVPIASTNFSHGASGVVIALAWAHLCD